ncbi:hypothetical protein Cob_v006619 [Colletotrichum orbiculare MAFF 240422]|uniref:Uncharacterized protein n=1 Tax=Colletotrichum orbiculare (strain 104-T / ATCC 96160 / CBS 514.97 / LARS 414 / MAFF 240422) TaxID=1213857 RepID=A0A484FR66_COLOR|nr:hypothetical protein Cob_v006619 [Colletotrichum orbiculare MAFF 240422]
MWHHSSSILSEPSSSIQHSILQPPSPTPVAHTLHCLPYTQNPIHSIDLSIHAIHVRDRDFLVWSGLS